MTTEDRIMELAMDAAPHVRWEPVEVDDCGATLRDAAERCEIDLDPRESDEVISAAIAQAVAEVEAKEPEEAFSLQIRIMAEEALKARRGE